MSTMNEEGPHRDLNAYLKAAGRRKDWLAKKLDISPSQVTFLLNRKKYADRRVSDDLVAKIAALLGQSATYVRKQFPEAK